MSTVVFSTTRWPLSWLIRILTGGPASHVVMGTTWCGVDVVVQADMLGTVVVTRARFAAANRIVEEYELPEMGDGLARAVGVLGERYDYPALLGYLPVLFFRWLGRKVRNPLASPKALLCVELLLELPILAWRDIDPDTATPEDLRQVCRAARFPQIVVPGQRVAPPRKTRPPPP